MNNFEDSPAYQYWLYQQYEPEDNLFVGRKPPINTPMWMLREYPMEEKTEQETLEIENAFLNKHGIDFK